LGQARRARQHHQPRHYHDPLAKDELAGPAWCGLSAHDRRLPGKAGRHPGRGGQCRGAAHGGGGSFHHRKRLPHGWRRDLILLVRRAGFEVKGPGNAFIVSVRAPREDRATPFVAKGMLTRMVTRPRPGRLPALAGLARRVAARAAFTVTEMNRGGCSMLVYAGRCCAQAVLR
jgi:hypothetical protein